MSIDSAVLARLLLADEPHLSQLSRLKGLEAILEPMVRADNPRLASRAATLAGLLATPEALTLIVSAASHASPMVRIAAIVATEFLDPRSAGRILIERLTDPDADVREAAIKLMTADLPKAVLSRLRTLAGDQAELPDLRKLCARLLEQLPERGVRPEPAGPPVPSIRDLDLDVDLDGIAMRDSSNDLMDEGSDRLSAPTAAERIHGELFMVPALRNAAPAGEGVHNLDV